MDRHEIFEAECARIREANAGLLARFEAWLSAKAFSGETARRHCRNADLYINHYLLYEDAIEAYCGVYHVGMYLGYWFPRKVSARDSAIRGQAASLRRFYQFMNEQSQVTDEAVRHLATEIRTSMPEWLVRARRYQ